MYGYIKVTGAFNHLMILLNDILPHDVYTIQYVLTTEMLFLKLFSTNSRQVHIPDDIKNKVTRGDVSWCHVVLFLSGQSVSLCPANCTHMFHKGLMTGLLPPRHRGPRGGVYEWWQTRAGGGGAWPVVWRWRHSVSGQTWYYFAQTLQ